MFLTIVHALRQYLFVRLWNWLLAHGYSSWNGKQWALYEERNYAQYSVNVETFETSSFRFAFREQKWKTYPIDWVCHLY